MTKYSLKKDLPKYPAGTEFRLTSKGHLASGDTMVYHKNDLERFPGILKDWFEEIPEEPQTVWDLEEGDDAWFIDGGTKKYVSMDETEFLLFQEKLEIGDGFATLEEAKKELVRRKAKQILLRDAKGFKPNIYNLDEKRYCVSYDPVSKELWYSYENYCDVSHSIIFATRKDVEASIKAHPKEWKVYLGVEE